MRLILSVQNGTSPEKPLFFSLLVSAVGSVVQQVDAEPVYCRFHLIVFCSWRLIAVPSAADPFPVPSSC